MSGQDWRFDETWRPVLEAKPALSEDLHRPLGALGPCKYLLTSDLFDERLSDKVIAVVFGVMAMTPSHHYTVPTKNAPRMRSWFEWVASGSCPETNEILATARVSLGCAMPYVGPSLEIPWPLHNVRLGAIVEDHPSACAQIPHLLQTPAAGRFVWANPFLGPIDLSLVPFRPGALNRYDGSALAVGDEGGRDYSWTARRMLDFVVITTAPARPCHRDWVRSLMRQCEESGVTFVAQGPSGVLTVVPPPGEKTDG